MDFNFCPLPCTPLEKGREELPRQVVDVLEEDKKRGRDSGQRFWQCSFWDTMEGFAKVKSSVWKEINIFESYIFSCLFYWTQSPRASAGRITCA